MRGVCLKAIWVFLIFSAGSAVAEPLELDCVPLPDPSGQGRDPVVKSFVSVSGGVWTVLHHLASGERIDRSDQYSITDISTPKAIAWRGVRLRSPDVSMVGRISSVDGTIRYEEIVITSKAGVVSTRTVGNICVVRREPQSSSPPIVSKRQLEQERAAQKRAVAERLEAENKAKAAHTEKVALLTKTIDLLRARLFDCVAVQAAPMMLTNETAAVVAKSAILLCNTETDGMMRAIAEKYEAENAKTLDRSVAETMLQDLVTARIVKARGEALQRSLDRPPPPPISNLPPT